MRRQSLNRRIYMGKVCAERQGALWSSYCKKVDVRIVRYFVVRVGEVEAPGRQVLLYHVLKARLEKRHLASLEFGHLSRVNIYTKHVMTNFCHASSMSRAQIAGSNYCKLH